MKKDNEIKTLGGCLVTTIIVLLLILGGVSKCNSQTYGEIRGGAITNIDGGGAISAGLTQHINKVSLSALFSAYTLGYGSYDSYDLEAGYMIGNESIMVSPIVGIGYDNERSFNGMDDGISLSGGVSAWFSIEGTWIGAGYRVRNGIQTAFMSVKLPLIFSKNNKHRFF